MKQRRKAMGKGFCARNGACADRVNGHGLRGSRPKETTQAKCEANVRNKVGRPQTLSPR